MTPIDEPLLARAIAARERVMHGNEIVTRATAEYHALITELHRAGASTREIADRLDLSHQRVHQIVGEPDEAAHVQPAGKRGFVKCTFCGKSQKQVEKLVAGPGVFICGECIDLCNQIINEEMERPPDLPR